MKQTSLACLFAFAFSDLSKVEIVLRIVVLCMPILLGIVQAIRRPPRRESTARRRPSSLPVIVAAGLIASVLVSGCSSTNVTQLVRALGSDTNAVSISVRSPWGTVDVRRNVP
jgi:hypothetical protein